MKAADVAVLALCVIGAAVLSAPLAMGFVLLSVIGWGAFRWHEVRSR